jgi:hypothetical protein
MYVCMHACMNTARSIHPSAIKYCGCWGVQSRPEIQSCASFFYDLVREKKSKLKSCLRLYADVWEDSTWHVLICFYSDWLIQLTLTFTPPVFYLKVNKFFMFVYIRKLHLHLPFVFIYKMYSDSWELSCAEVVCPSILACSYHCWWLFSNHFFVLKFYFILLFSSVMFSCLEFTLLYISLHFCVVTNYLYIAWKLLLYNKNKKIDYKKKTKINSMDSQFIK